MLLEPPSGSDTCATYGCEITFNVPTYLPFNRDDDNGNGIADYQENEAVAGDDEEVQVGPSGSNPAGHGQRAAVKSVEAVGLHVVRQPAGTADARNENGLLRRKLLRGGQPLRRKEDGVVAAAGAPAGHRPLIVLRDEFAVFVVATSEE